MIDFELGPIHTDESGRECRLLTASRTLYAGQRITIDGRRLKRALRVAVSWVVIARPPDNNPMRLVLSAIAGDWSKHNLSGPTSTARLSTRLVWRASNINFPQGCNVGRPCDLHVLSSLPILEEDLQLLLSNPRITAATRAADNSVLCLLLTPSANRRNLKLDVRRALTY